MWEQVIRWAGEHRRSQPHWSWVGRGVYTRDTEPEKYPKPLLSPMDTQQSRASSPFSKVSDPKTIA